MLAAGKRNVSLGADGVMKGAAGSADEQQALAAMIGAMFILDDPIFNGLAISLVFGLFSSTVLTLVVIPVLYFLYLRHKG